MANADIPAAPDTRQERSRRLKIFIPATLTYCDIKVRAHILDVSSTGARVHADIAPGSGQRVSLSSNGSEFSGLVVWVKGTRFGVSFDRLLSAEEIEVML